MVRYHSVAEFLFSNRRENNDNNHQDEENKTNQYLERNHDGEIDRTVYYQTAKYRLEELYRVLKDLIHLHNTKQISLSYLLVSCVQATDGYLCETNSQHIEKRRKE